MAESVTFTLTPEIVEKLTQLAVNTGENKSELIRRLIEQAWQKRYTPLSGGEIDPEAITKDILRRR